MNTGNPAQRKRLEEVPSNLRIEFQRSLGMSITIALSLLGIAEEFEGFDPWVYSTYAALADDLRQDIRTLFTPFGNSLFFAGLLSDGIQTHSLPELIEWIQNLDADRIERSNYHCLEVLAAHEGQDNPFPSPDALRDPEMLRRHLPALLASHEYLEQQTRQYMHLLANPESLKAHLVYVIARFWDRHYRRIYQSCSAMEEKSVQALESQTLPSSFLEVFQHIIGRPFPEALGPQCQTAEVAVFIPSCHCGPYMSVDAISDDGKTLTIVYNCRATGAGALRHDLPVQEMFAPLKALADETRLEIVGLLTGQELYAQQIVDQMDISQSAVSRHLRLLVTCGVLEVRRHEGMKFYKLRQETLAELEERLSALRAQDAASAS